MAKAVVADLSVKLGIQNEELLTKLKGSLRGISSVAKVSERGLREVAKAVKDYKNNGVESIAVIRGQVNALKSLQEQADTNSSIFRKLGKDIGTFEGKLKDAERAAKNLRIETRRKGSFLKKDDPGGFFAAVTGMQQDAQKKPSPMFDKDGQLTEEYIQQQAKLAVNLEARERMEARVEARIRSITKAQSDNSRTVRTSAEILDVFGASLKDLPATTNNLGLELKELREDLGNLVIGGDKYISTLLRINEIQKRLDFELPADPSDPTGRKADIRSRLGRKPSFGFAVDESRQDPIQKSIERNRRKVERRRAAMYGGSGVAPLMLDQPREASGLFRTIASIGSAEAKAATEMMGRSLSQVTAEIKKQAAASNGSVNSLNAQKAAFAQLRAGLDPTSQDFRRLGIEIDKIDRKLSKLGKKKFSLKGAAQSVGAIASAGIFGGAAGGAGALVGSLFGPGGAVVGGGIGTTAGIAAQQISGFTDYAASISLAEKALDRIISKEGEYAENARKNLIANQTIEFAIKKLNVEREDATVGMTRLAAAVLGANGTIEQASLAFLGTTMAIKATKGSADDVRGGITALVQMFSKGRISAEELSGQLGERFPAAVTAFARANNISGAVLQKQLKDGKVGLDKLINFLVFAVKNYKKGALEMAESAEESGLRQKRSFDEVRRNLGKQLINVGERLQEGIADSLTALTPVIVNVATMVANVVGVIIDGIVLVVRNFRTLIDVVVVLSGGAVIGMLIKQLIILSGVIGKKGLVFALKLAVRTITKSMIPALGKMIGLVKALTLAMARNPFILVAMGITAIGVAAFKASRRFEDFVTDIKLGVLSLKEITQGIDGYQKRLDTLGKINAIIQKDPTGAAAKGLTADDGRMSRIGAGTKPNLTPDAIEVRNLVRTLDDDTSLKALGPIRNARDLRNAMKDDAGRIRRAKLASQETSGLLGFDLDEIVESAFGDKDLLKLLGDTKDKGKKDLTLKQLEAQKALLFEVKTLEDVQKKLVAEKAVINLEDLKTNQKALRVAQAEFQAEQATARINEQMKSLHENILAQRDKALLATKEITLEEFNRRELARQRVQLEAQLQPLLDNGKLTLEEINKIIDDIINGVKEGQDKGKGFEQGLRDLIDEAIDLNKQLGEFGVQAIDSFADAFADFVTTGKASFTDFANSIIKDLTRIFIRAAFFQAIDAIFPGLGTAAKTVTQPQSRAQKAGWPGNRNYAKGGVFAKNKIVPYAMGGIVNKPTLFPMANGAGLMGEAGPEAIMPLRRGANGKLGVEASGSGIGNITVNVDASGSSVEGDASEAAQLGKMLGAAVQAELVKQKRPGGLLAS